MAVESEASAYAVNLGIITLDLQDPTFWALIGLIIFVLLAVYVMKAPKTVTQSLDDRAAKITAELAAAEALRAEAEAKLAEAKLRQAEAEAEAAAIVEAARREAEQLEQESKKSLAERIALREKLAKERIERAEADAIREVKLTAIDTASKAAAAILTEQLSGTAADGHFAASLESVKKALTQ